MTRPKRTASFAWSIWGWPIALAVLSCIILPATLLGDGWWDAVSWLGLGIPTVVCALYGLRRR